MKFGISQSMTRKEDAALLRGAGRYVSDHAPRGATHAVVLRSPDNGYLTGFSIAANSGSPYSGGEASSVVSRQPFADAEAFMSAVDMQPWRGDKTAQYAVLAPANAVTVRAGQFTAPVTNRLAMLRTQPPEPGQKTPQIVIEALDASGQLITKVRSQPADTTFM